MSKCRLDLSCLQRTTAQVIDDSVLPEEGQVSITLEFSDGTRLKAVYWRLIVDGRRHQSSFDHGQKYGLQSPVDAKEGLRSILTGRECVDVRLETETGDLRLDFADNVHLQVFNFTGYEIWTIYFADGRVQYSNYV
jgi:hypothetical protein